MTIFGVAWIVTMAIAKTFKGLTARQFRCWDQFLAMAFSQLTHRESLRDIEVCLEVHRSKLFHSGLQGPVKRSTLADANESRDWRIYR
jgi:hypothetical protein